MDLRQSPPLLRGSDLLRGLASEGLDVSERQMSYWRQLGLLRPTRTGTGGSPWRYGERDLLVVRILALSIRQGVSVQSVQRALRMLDDLGGIPHHGAIITVRGEGVWRVRTVFACAEGPVRVGGRDRGEVVVW